MTEVLHSPSSSSSSSSSQTHDNNTNTFFHTLSQEDFQEYNNNNNNSTDNNNNQLSLLALLLTLLRKSFWGSSGNSDNNNNKNSTVTEEEERLDLSGMEIGWPTDVRHVAHVTFDRFNGFLGLPVEFEPEVLRRAPSASATVFGVSTESMQLAYDARGNSIPVILILMQQRLYSQGGLKAEGIFRINADNNQEEDLRTQLNSGVVPEGIDVHCLAGLIKAWFRELPTGVLDPLSPEQVIQCQSEDDCSTLCRLLPPTETALLDWAINLMADVAQYEHLNKMNSHNIAMVFAPNMTQMVDPLTALMYAVQVMNFLRTLIVKTLREREDRVVESYPGPSPEPSDENGDQGPALNINPQENHDEYEDNEHQFITDDDDHPSGYLAASEESDGPRFCALPPPIEPRTTVNHTHEPKPAQTSVPDSNQPLVQKSKEMSNLSSIKPQTERVEAWRGLKER